VSQFQQHARKQQACLNIIRRKREQALETGARRRELLGSNVPLRALPLSVD
jgi:hypothetical protein